MNRRKPITADDVRHGTRAGYKAGCSYGTTVPFRPIACEPCLAANRRHEKVRRHRALNGRPGYLPALGVQRRIRALVALGWPMATLAPKLGISEQALLNLLYPHGRTRGQVQQATYVKVSDLYDRLSMTPGPSERARQMARRRSWAPPLAWDDDELDDPNAVAQVAPAYTTRLHDDPDPQLIERALAGERVHGAILAERLEVARRWEASGRSLNSLNRLQGWNSFRDRREQQVAA